MPQCGAARTRSPPSRPPSIGHRVRVSEYIRFAALTRTRHANRIREVRYAVRRSARENRLDWLIFSTAPFWISQIITHPEPIFRAEPELVLLFCGVTMNCLDINRSLACLKTITLNVFRYESRVYLYQPNFKLFWFGLKPTRILSTAAEGLTLASRLRLIRFRTSVSARTVILTHHGTRYDNSSDI